MEFLEDEKIKDVQLVSFEYEDFFIPHGKTADIEKYLGIMPKQIAKKLEG